MSFAECGDAAGGPALDFTDGADAQPDFASGAIAGGPVTIQWDPISPESDEDTRICSAITVPPDYASSGLVLMRAPVASCVVPASVGCSATIDTGPPGALTYTGTVGTFTDSDDCALPALSPNQALTIAIAAGRDSGTMTRRTNSAQAQAPKAEQFRGLFDER